MDLHPLYSSNNNARWRALEGKGMVKVICVMRDAGKQETPVYHGVRKGSFSQQVRIEPAFEKWRELNK